MAEPRDRDLVRLYWPAKLRPAFDALFAIDAAMGEVVRTSSQPMLGAIRLAWWRERLEELDKGAVPAEPRLKAVAAELAPRGIAGSDLAVLEGPWGRLFDDFPWGLQTAEAIWFRGRHVFALGARLLGESSKHVEAAGGGWALTDAARHCSDARSRAVLTEQARVLTRALKGASVPKALRPLTMLGVLAIRDAERGEPFEPEGSPARAAALIRHRLTGRL